MSFLSDIQRELRMARLTRRGATHRPEDVPRGTHKAYPRMQQFKLPMPEALSTTLGDSLQRRTSYFGGSDSSPLSLEQCGTLFGIALGKHADSTRRMYPSGGALYPIETYIVSNAIERSEPAVFHYNPTEHSLEKLWDLPADIDVKDLARYPDDLFFSSLIVFTSVWKRSSAKYGDLSYQHALLEAGHMSENVLLVATALGLNARPMAGFNDDLIVSLLDIDPEEENPVHSITLY